MNGGFRINFAQSNGKAAEMRHFPFAYSDN